MENEIIKVVSDREFEVETVIPATSKVEKYNVDELKTQIASLEADKAAYLDGVQKRIDDLTAQLNKGLDAGISLDPKPVVEPAPGTISEESII